MHTSEIPPPPPSASPLPSPSPRTQMLERMESPHPADEGVDPRYMCLVVFLCEGGHHVTDWVAPASMRPYLRHAAAYPYKKKAYAGTARLQVGVWVYGYVGREVGWKKSCWLPVALCSVVVGAAATGAAICSVCCCLFVVGGVC